MDNKMNKRELKLEEVFNTDYFEDYYKNYRKKMDDFFKSEKHFFSDFISVEKSYIDVGCAQGGFYKVLKDYAQANGKFDYVGIDLSKRLIDLAKETFPSIDFRVQDGSNLPFETASIDRALSLGTTIHDQNFEDLLRECYRVSKEYFLYDIRLIKNLPSVKTLDKGYVLDDTNVKYPYLVINYDQHIEFIKKLSPLPMEVTIYGYQKEPNQFTTLPEEYQMIYMATILVKKGQPLNKLINIQNDLLD